MGKEREPANRRAFRHAFRAAVHPAAAPAHSRRVLWGRLLVHGLPRPHDGRHRRRAAHNPWPGGMRLFLRDQRVSRRGRETPSVRRARVHDGLERGRCNLRRGAEARGRHRRGGGALPPDRRGRVCHVPCGDSLATTYGRLPARRPSATASMCCRFPARDSKANPAGCTAQRASSRNGWGGKAVPPARFPCIS